MSTPTQPTIISNTPPPTPSQLPITYVLSVLSITTAALVSLSKGLSTLVITPAYHLLYRPLSYLLAPALLFLAIVLEFFVWTPLAVVRYLAEQVYPLYLLVGVACICGAVVGLVSRGVAAAAIGTVMAGTRVDEVKAEKVVAEPQTGKQGRLRRGYS